MEWSAEMEIGHLANLFLLQYIYIAGMESGNESASYSECSQVPVLDFKFSCLDSVFLDNWPKVS